jgi:hypothetical protein
MSREAGRACVITIKKRREMVGKSWMSPVRLVVELRLRHDDHEGKCTSGISPNFASATDR